MAKSLTVALPENLTIAGVEKLHQEFEGIIQQDQAIIIDASQVCRADTAGLQLVCGLVMDLVKHNLAFSWGEVSDVFRNAARLLGLEGVLQLVESNCQEKQ